MTAKIAIVESLGERAVLLPSLAGEALAANERLKLRLTLLQEAAVQATQPGRQPRDFTPERQRAGLNDPDLDGLVTGARLTAPERLFLPGAAALFGPIGAELAAMLAPLTAADPQASRALAGRVEHMRGALPSGADGEVGLADIAALASASPEGGDSLHRLIMDLHRALNALAATASAETLDGARVLGLADIDRPRIAAFMRGLHRTAPLAFGHPGLDTTAVNAAGRLTIQNDLGTTMAHVLVIHVSDREVTVTYTDVHRGRAKFFVSLFAEHGVEWSPFPDKAAGAVGGEPFYLLTARYTARDEAALQALLEFLGSRLVFIIDWNKARKALQIFVGRSGAVELLSWAARHDLGHRAFLELGGAELLFEIIRNSAADHIPYGARLDSVLGAAETIAFLQQLLRETSEGLAAGRTARLIRDEIQADLAHRFDAAKSTVLTLLVRHLGLSRMLAGRILDVFATLGLTTTAERRGLALRAKTLEEKADRLTVQARERAARLREGRGLRPLIDEVESVMDALEDCAFLLGLMTDEVAAGLSAVPLARLAEIAMANVGDLVRAVEAASRLPEGERADYASALELIDAVALGERRADAAERDIIAASMLAPGMAATPMIISLEAAHALEAATDHLCHSALLLRDHVLRDLSA